MSLRRLQQLSFKKTYIHRERERETGAASFHLHTDMNLIRLVLGLRRLLDFIAAVNIQRFARLQCRGMVVMNVCCCNGLSHRFLCSSPCCFYSLRQ